MLRAPYFKTNVGNLKSNFFLMSIWRCWFYKIHIIETNQTCTYNVHTILNLPAAEIDIFRGYLTHMRVSHREFNYLVAAWQTTVASWFKVHYPLLDRFPFMPFQWISHDLVQFIKILRKQHQLCVNDLFR